MKRLLVVSVGIALVAALLFEARALGIGFPQEEPAQASVTPPRAALHLRAEGRVVARPGAEVTLGTETGGRLVRLFFHEKDVVEKDAVVAEMDAEEERSTLAEAGARVAECQADVAFFSSAVARHEGLVASGAGVPDALDHARHDLDAGRARLDAVLSALQRAEVVLAKRQVRSPLAGVVTARIAEEGEILAQGSALLTVADLSRTRVEAEVDEFDATRVALDAPVHVTAEGSSGDGWKGHVEEIPDAVTSRRLHPLDPGRPTDTRVLMVKVCLEGGASLKLGQRVEVEIAASP